MTQISIGFLQWFHLSPARPSAEIRQSTSARRNPCCNGQGSPSNRCAAQRTLTTQDPRLPIWPQLDRIWWTNLRICWIQMLTVFSFSIAVTIRASFGFLLSVVLFWSQVRGERPCPVLVRKTTNSLKAYGWQVVCYWFHLFWDCHCHFRSAFRHFPVYLLHFLGLCGNSN